MLDRVGHRGAPRVFPANTLRSFEEARALGCNMVECDIRLSQDGVLVLAHDPHVRDANGETWMIADHPEATLAALDLGAGEGVPTLDALIAWCARTGVKVMADMKCESGDVESRVARALSALPPAQKCVSGAGAESRARFRMVEPALPLLLSADRAAIPDDATFARLLSGLDTDGVSWEYPLMTPERAAALHARGKRIYCWTVDDPEIMRRLVACPVDGITSNRADLLAALYFRP